MGRAARGRQDEEVGRSVPVRQAGVVGDRANEEDALGGAEFRREAREVSGEGARADHDQRDVVLAEKRQRAQEAVDSHARLEAPYREQKGAVDVEPQAAASGSLPVAGGEPLGVDEAGHSPDARAVQTVVLEEQ